MRSFSKPLAAALGAILLAGELAIGVLSLGSVHEPQMYRDFYISHRRDCWMPARLDAGQMQALHQVEISPPVLGPQAACAVFAQGWISLQPFGQTQSKTAWAELPFFKGAKALELTLVNLSLKFPQTVTVSLNGTPGGRLVLPPGHAPLALDLGLPPQSGSGIEIRFDTQPAPDGGPLAVLRLKWIMND